MHGGAVTASEHSMCSSACSCLTRATSCIRLERIGATIFPGLIKVTHGATLTVGSSVQTLVRWTQVVCRCALFVMAGTMGTMSGVSELRRFIAQGAFSLLSPTVACFFITLEPLPTRAALHTLPRGLSQGRERRSRVLRRSQL